MGNLVPLHFCEVSLFLGTNLTDLQHNNLVNNITHENWTTLKKLSYMQHWQTTMDFLSFTDDKWDANPNYRVSANYAAFLALLDID